jgi:histidinol phosphatase-like PHP family hydrolase
MKHKRRGFGILLAVEMNLSTRGEGDQDPSFLLGLNLVIGALHSRLRLTEDQTDRYVAALSNSSRHIRAHPRGRIFNFRVGLQAGWRRVFQCAHDHNRAVEIDYPDRRTSTSNSSSKSALMSLRTIATGKEGKTFFSKPGAPRRARPQCPSLGRRTMSA